MKKVSSVWRQMAMPVRGLLQASVLVGAAWGLSACGGANGDTSATPAPQVDSTGKVIPSAAAIFLTTNAPSLQNSGTAAVVATVQAIDSNNNLLAGVPVKFSVDSSAFVRALDTVTNEKGEARAEVTVGSERSNRTITVTAISGTKTATSAITVTGSRLAVTLDPPSVVPNGVGSMTFKLTDINARGMADKPIVISGLAGAEIKGVTDKDGSYRYDYTAPANAGTFTVRAAAAGVSISSDLVVLTSSQSIASADALPKISSASLQLSTDVVPVNLGNTDHRVEVRAMFVRENNQPAERIRVRFSLPDPFNVGGSLSTGSRMVYSDALGTVSTNFIPGAIDSPTDGLIVRACWDFVDFAATSCPNEVRTTLTVTGEPLSVSVGTNNEIRNGETGVDYIKDYIVQVNDSAGVAKADVDLSVVVDLPRFALGYYYPIYDANDAIIEWRQKVTHTCDNEDLNRNAASDAYSNGVVEDANGNGQLDPRKADVIVSFVGNARTNAAGQALLRIAYPEDKGSWAFIKLDVTASRVGASEGRAAFTSWLPVASADLKTTAGPAFANSPYNHWQSDRENSDISYLAVATPDGLKQAVVCKRTAP